MKVLQTKALLSLLITIPAISFGSQLSLETFLKQVETKNQSISASQLIISSADNRSGEGKLIFRPSLFAEARALSDQKPTANVNAQGNRTDMNFISAGVMQQFNFGLQGKLSYTLSQTKIYNALPMFLPQNSFHDAVANFELTQSLIRNFNGLESRSLETIITAQAMINKYSENFKITSLLSQAESLYWSLSQFKKVIIVQKESLERAQKIKLWNQKRLQSGLAENSDFLQADANFKAREYELSSSLQDLKNLKRSLNSLRGIDNAIVDEELDSLDFNKIHALTQPFKTELRDDTKAALEMQKMSQANAALSIEKNKPTLELYGSYALNGRDKDHYEAAKNSFSTDHNTKAIGIRLVTPLDFSTTNDNISGYKKEQIASEQNYQRKLFEQEQQWNDLSSKLADAKIKLSLIEKIAEAQKIKVINERDRLSKGRTVTFQVLNFEQDYAQSELAKIQAETNILNIYSQLKIFNNGGSK